MQFNFSLCGYTLLSPAVVGYGDGYSVVRILKHIL
jgi:hypothetical protein